MSRWGQRWLRSGALLLLSAFTVQLAVGGIRAGTSRLFAPPVDVAALVPRGALSDADFGNGSAPLEYHAPHAAVTVLTFATTVNRELQWLVHGLARAGYAYRVLGVGSSGFSWARRMDAYREAASAIAGTRGDARWLVVVDAYDTVPLRLQRELATALASGDIVVPPGAVLSGADAFCWSNCRPLDDAWWTSKGVTPPPYFRHPDAGTLLGRAADIAALYSWALQHNPTDDQVALSMFLHENATRGAPDHTRSVFANIGLGALPRHSFALLVGTPSDTPSSRSEVQDNPVAPFFAHFPYQQSESGTNRVLYELVSHVAAIPRKRARSVAAHAVEIAWPTIRVELERAHAARVSARSTTLALAIAVAVLSGLLFASAVGYAMTEAGSAWLGVPAPSRTVAKWWRHFRGPYALIPSVGE